MSQPHTEEKEEKEDSLSPSPSTTKETYTDIEITDTNKTKTNKEALSTFNPPKKTILSSGISQSTNNLLSANYNPKNNPKKDEIVQTASIKILEVESLLDKLNDHIDRHHRKSSQKLQDFEQIHSELSKIQMSINEDTNNKDLDPFIIIASNTDADDEEKDDEKKDDDDIRSPTIRNDLLPKLEPFQSLVHKIQKEMDPNITSEESSDDNKDKDNDNDNDNDHESKSPNSPSTELPLKSLKLEKKSSIKLKKSDLDTMQDYVKEHRNKMKEKTYQYEEKKRQLKNAKERLNKAKARFKKRLNKSKQRSARNRANSANTRKARHPMLNIHATSDMSPNYKAALSPTTKFHVINENSDADNDEFVNSLSAANLSKFNHHGTTVSDSDAKKLDNNDHTLSKQISVPMYLTSPKSTSANSSPGSGKNNGYAAAYNIIGMKHHKSTTNSSVQSAFSTISDQSFVEDFHSITAELENIDNLVRNQVKSPSMASIFSDKSLISSPKQTSHSNGSSDDKIKGHQTFFKDMNKDDHIKNNMSSYSESDSKETGKTMQSYYSEADSLQSEILQLQGLEGMISDI